MERMFCLFMKRSSKLYAPSPMEQERGGRGGEERQPTNFGANTTFAQHMDVLDVCVCVHGRQYAVWHTVQVYRRTANMRCI